MSSYIIIGKGGREHALAVMLAKHGRVYSFGGSDAIRQIAEPLDNHIAVSLDAPLSDAALDALLSKPDATIVFGPEQPMAAGWVDQIRMKSAQARVLGPNQYAAQLESSKWWAKEFMMRNRVPTGEARRIKTVRDFDSFALQFEPPYVIKADGLAAGKGVAIFPDASEARRFVEGIVSGKLFGAPQTALIEEFLAGPELSIFLLLDGSSAAQIGTARDFKRVSDNDEGPNTGGMGSYTPVPDVSTADQGEIYRTVLRPILDGLKQDGLFYRGFLYVGLIRTSRGFRVLEFNVRMGDPETQAVLPVLGDHLSTLLDHAANGVLSRLRGSSWVDAVADDFLRVTSDRAAVCVVLAAPGYPGEYPSGLPLTGLDTVDLNDGTHIFHAGTKRSGREWVTNGGRVLNVVSVAGSVRAARTKTYDGLKRLGWSHLHFRRDIAEREDGA